VPPFRAAQIVGARFAFFVSLAHVKDRLKQGDGVFESGLGNRSDECWAWGSSPTWQIVERSLVELRGIAILQFWWG
jgi:hypothetical protein